MPKTLGEWIQFLGKRPLPAMAASKVRVIRLLNSSSATNTDLQRIIGRDPGFSLDLFRHYAGAAGSPKEAPGSLAHAISLLGQTSLSNLLQRLPVLEQIPEGRVRTGLAHCYSRAFHASHYAHRWGLDREDSNPDELGLAALLFNCGEMALRTHAIEEMDRIEARVAAGADYASGSRAVLGFTLQQLGMALAELWRLPPLVASALSEGWPLQTRPQKVVLATALARETERDWGSAETRDLTDLLAEILLISPDHAGARLHSLAAETARDILALPLPLTAASLVSLSPDPGQAAEQAPALAAADAAAETTAIPIPANALQQQLARITTRMRKEIGLDRVMFAVLNRDRRGIKARFVTGGDKDDPLRRFNCRRDKRNLFSVLLSKPQAFWLNDDNREKYLPLIPEVLREAVDNRGFFIMSIYVRNKPVGLLYADTENPETLNEDGYGRFKQLCQQLCNQLAGGR